MPRMRRRVQEEEELAKAFRTTVDDGPVADAVYRAIADAILASKLPAGWRLREERLATVFNVSRTPIREALMRLEAQRLAQRDHRSGLVVGGLTAREIIEVYVIREALDGVAARQAARYGLEEDIAALEQMNQLIAAAANTSDYAKVAVANVRFHELLAAASRNGMLQRFMEDIHRSVRRFRGTTFSLPGRAEEGIREHQELIEAIRSRDGERAEQVAREHMRRGTSLRMVMEANTQDPTGALAGTGDTIGSDRPAR